MCHTRHMYSLFLEKDLRIQHNILNWGGGEWRDVFTSKCSHTVALYSDHANLHSYQLHMRSLVDPYPCQLLALSVFYHFNQLSSR